MTQPDLETVLERLRQGALEALIDLCLDDLATRPIASFVRADRVASHTVDALKEAAASPQLEDKLRAQLAPLRGATVEPDADGRSFPVGETLRDHLPQELTDPIQELLAEPWLPERELVLRLLDHDAMRTLIQEVLHASLMRFAQKMRSFKPDTSKIRAGLGRRVPTGLSRLRDLGTGVVSVVGSEIESQLDARVGEFVSQAISAVLGHVATLFTAPERAETMGDWRAYGMAVVLDTELEAFAAEARKMDPDRAVAATAQAIRALAQRESLEEELRTLVRTTLEPWQERSLQAQLEALGLEKAWRASTREWLQDQLEPVLNTTAFHAWLQALLGPADKI